MVVRVRGVCGGLVFALGIAACGSDPKPDPTAPTGTTTASATPPPPMADMDAGSAASSTAPPADAGKSDKQAECDALIDDANSTLDAERIAVDKLCKKDTDCMPIKGRACGFVCVNAAIPKIEEKDWNESLTKVKEGACKKWTENECAKLKTKPPPTCQDRKVWCDKGHCALKDK
jgi:hypothetical protein